MEPLDPNYNHETVLGDLHRIARWLAEDVDNENAQEAAADLTHAADYIEWAFSSYFTA